MNNNHISDDQNSDHSKQAKRILTGIKPTGTLHLGNYVGAIRPAIQSIQNSDDEAFFFLADYHGIIGCYDPTIMSRPRPLQRLGLLVVLILSASLFIVNQTCPKYQSLHGF